MFAILDIETTGGSPKFNRMTEIAIYIFDGTRIIEEFSTLINPEVEIPYFITNLTGISNEMVENAPKFYEVAKKIVELTEGKILVGHNVSFDYSFIQNEFRQLGYVYNRKTLCTVRLSRKTFPGHRSYSLGKICEQLGIQINGRHRAKGDAFATLKLFETILKNTEGSSNELWLSVNNEKRGLKLNEFLKPEQVNAIPEETGVYYFYDSSGNIIYIGKSKNIHKRVLEHLGNHATRRSMDLRNKIAGISFEVTGSELVALLKESMEIKEFKPYFNRAQKRITYPFGLYQSRNEFGYIQLRISKISEENSIPLQSFENKIVAKSYLSAMVKKHWLCHKLCGLYETEGACFHYSIRQCNGACIRKEAVKTYNSRVGKLISGMSYEDENQLIIDRGRSPSERSVICIENGSYKGFGYLEITDSYLSIDDMKDCITRASDNKDIRNILSSWMHRNKVEKIIRY
jgi:DNA polymerase-3 subunit epsilon